LAIHPLRTLGNFRSEMPFQLGDPRLELADRTHAICAPGLQERPIGRRAGRTVEKEDRIWSARSDRSRQRYQIVLRHFSNKKNVRVRCLLVFATVAFPDGKSDPRLGDVAQRHADDNDEE